MRGWRAAGRSDATIVVVGLGHLGGAVLDALALEPGVGRIVACSPDIARGRARVNLARINAAVRERLPRLEHRPIDLRRPGQLAELIADVRPEVAVNCASRQTWWLLDLLPPSDAAALRRAGFGAWLPVHLDLALCFAREMTDAGFSAATLNGAYPDVVNHVLGKRGIAPTSGFGNVDEIAVKVALLAGERMGRSPGDVEVTLVAHHALEPFAFGSADDAVENEPPPFHLSLRVDGEDVTEAAGGRQLALAAYSLPAGPAWASFTASCAARFVGRLLAPETSRLHAPGPEGLPGGYPVDVGAGNVTLAEVHGLGREGAIAINQAAQACEGVAEIQEDGTFVLSEASEGILHEQLGYRGGRVSPDDVPAKASELVAKLSEYAREKGVDLGRIAGAVR